MKMPACKYSMMGFKYRIKRYAWGCDSWKTCLFSTKKAQAQIRVLLSCRNFRNCLDSAWTHEWRASCMSHHGSQLSDTPCFSSKKAYRIIYDPIRKSTSLHNSRTSARSARFKASLRRIWASPNATSICSCASVFGMISDVILMEGEMTQIFQNNLLFSKKGKNAKDGCLPVSRDSH